MVDSGSGHHLLRVEDDVGAFLLEKVDADRVGGACDDVGRRVPVLDGLERGQIGIPVVGEDERDLRHGQPFHEVRVPEVANERFVLLVPKILHPFFVLIDDDEIFVLLLELLGDVIAGAPAAKNDVFDTFLRNVLDRLRHAYNGVTSHGIKGFHFGDFREDPVRFIPYPVLHC
ncbi:hypothetical protein ES707_10134 [subsurface metagenome]